MVSRSNIKDEHYYVAFALMKQPKKELAIFIPKKKNLHVFTIGKAIFHITESQDIVIVLW